MSEPTLTDTVRELIDEHGVLLFMKGTPEAPRCGFSMRTVAVLEQLGVDYAAVDVLPALDPLRQATGEIADWRTFPQLYVKGELVGGCDIVEEMFASGELAELLDAEPTSGAASSASPPGAAEASDKSAKQQLQQDPQQSPPLQIER